MGFTTDKEAVEPLSKYSPGKTYCGEDGDIKLYAVWQVETGVKRFGIFIIIAIGSMSAIIVLTKKTRLFKRL